MPHPTPHPHPNPNTLTLTLILTLTLTLRTKDLHHTVVRKLGKIAAEAMAAAA